MIHDETTPWWRTRSAIVLFAFIAIAGFFVLAGHTAHVLGALPYLLILACPLMHLFHGHGGRHDHAKPRDAGEAPPGPPEGGR